MILDKLFLGSKYFFAILIFFANLWIVNIVNTADFGELSFYRLSLQYLQYAELGLLQYVFRSLSAEEKIYRSDVNNIVSVLLISVLSFFSLYSLVGYEYSFFTDNRFILILLFAVFFGFITKHSIDKLRIENNTKMIVLLEFISMCLLFIGIGFSLNSNNKLFWIIITYGVYQIPYSIYFFLFLYRGVFFKFNLRIKKDVLNDSIMLALFAFFSLLFFSVDRLIIKFYWGFQDLGLYAFPLTVVNGAFIVLQSILWLNMPNFIHSIKNSSDKTKTRMEFKTYRKKLLIIYGVLFLFGAVCYKILITFFLEKYESTFTTFILLFVFYLFSLLYIYEQNYLIVYKKYKILVLSFLSIAVLNFSINYFLSIYHKVELLIFVSIICHLLVWLFLKFKVNKCII
jgi:O-antigen/teichoic acid export membrane protein